MKEHHILKLDTLLPIRKLWLYEQVAIAFVFTLNFLGKLSGFVLTLALLNRESQNPDCQIIGAILTLIIVKNCNKEWFFCKKFSIYSTTVILNIFKYTFSWFFSSFLPVFNTTLVLILYHLLVLLTDKKLPQNTPN